MTSRRPSSATDRVSHMDALLELDPFRFTRSDEELAEFERDSVAKHARPYQHLINTLLGVGDATDETKSRSLWESIVSHRRELGEKLGRPVPLRAAAIDWLYLRDEAQRPFRAIVVSKSMLAAAIEEGRTDELTGLQRRAAFEESLDELLKARPLIKAALVYVDLDGFKRANDQFGHERGDHALRSFARVVQESLRKDDLVGRVGGDEFAMLLPSVGAADARDIVERVRARFEQACAAEGVSFSFGVAELSPRDTVSTAMKRADRAMYQQKRQRKRGA